jgi:ribosomal protein S18 acetylase RimI-like enzyme
MIIVQEAIAGDQIAAVRQMFRQYAASLSFALDFQDFDAELASLPGAYAPPGGRLWLALRNGQAVGCAALRPLSDDVCEMKRFYVRPDSRGHGIGRRLATTCIEAARAIGYARIRLDTVPEMTAAIALYESLGFRDIDPYCANPIAGARFMELTLRPAEPAGR